MHVSQGWGKTVALGFIEIGGSVPTNLGTCYIGNVIGYVYLCTYRCIACITLYALLFAILIQYVWVSLNDMNYIHRLSIREVK